MSTQTTIKIKVTPKASSNRIVEEVTETGETLYRIYLTTVPEDGKANKDAIKLLAKHLNLPKSSLQITHGHTSREKIIKISA